MIPFIEKHLATTKHVVIWDQYLSDSLKATTRVCRGARARQRSYGNGKIAKNWNSYLRNETNKIELFEYLSGVIAQSNFDESKVVAVSQGAFPGADPGGQDSLQTIIVNTVIKIMVYVANFSFLTRTLPFQNGWICPCFLDSTPSRSKSTGKACQLWMHKNLCRKVLMLQEGLVCTARCKCAGKCYKQPGPTPTPTGN